jgi:hypothetical protein
MVLGPAQKFVPIEFGFTAIRNAANALRRNLHAAARAQEIEFLRGSRPL